MYTPDSFSAVSLRQRMGLLRLLFHHASVTPFVVWQVGLVGAEPGFHKMLPGHIA